MNSAPEKQSKYLPNKAFLLSCLSGVVLLLLSLVLNFYAGTFALERASNYVGDIILSNTRVYDVDVIFVWGPVVFWIFIAALCLLRPQKIPFTLKSIALFLVVRSIFVSLTHIGPYPDEIAITTGVDFIRAFTSGGDLFFSAHTGLPFLMALVFYNNKKLRIFFICAAVFFGIIVLLAHKHYTIDVLSAFFITYTIYKISAIFFRDDKKIFDQGVVGNS